MARYILAACIAAVLLVVCSAQSDTTGQKLEGYTFGSNVAGYLDVSKDVCDYEAALKKSPPNWAGAEKLYTDGANSKKGDGSLRTLKGMTGPFKGEPFFEQYANFYNSPEFLDKQIVDALKGAAPWTVEAARIEAAEKSVKTMLQWIFVFHELDSAAKKIRETLLSASTGAPHNVDEAYAVYVGGAKSCGLYDQILKRGTAFGTLATCEAAKANELALKAFNGMYAAAREGKASQFEQARKELERVMVIHNIQNVLRYSKVMDDNIQDKKDALYAQAEAFIFFRTIAPLINATNPAAVKEILPVMTPGTPITTNTTTRVTAALKPVYSKWNLTETEVGSNGAKSPLVCAPPASSPAAKSAAAIPASAGSLAAAAAAAVLFALL